MVDLNAGKTEDVVKTGQESLENPNNLADVLKKRDELKTISDVKRGRGRPRKDSIQGGTGTSGKGSDVSAPIPADLFTADSIRAFIELPFGLSNIWLKTRAFSLDKIESDTLSHQGALVCNLYAPGWNPKAVALTAFALGFASIATNKLLVYFGEQKEKEEKKKLDMMKEEKK